ncbi:zinc finger protein 54-like [Bicyclus anynana]|uniref:Zinc finger protein 54-like n=1 Tax=Bicyclus anynana TaxID=110368 RepID=A0A6J1P4T5_BICAN|nr:zinc finger protein 54-like [Bicyclus anynana]
MNKKSYICRVCLDSRDVFVSLSETYQDFVLYEFINNLTNLNIRLSDGFPDKICDSCYSILKSSIDFKEKCESSDVILRSNGVKEEIFHSDVKSAQVKSEESAVGVTVKIEFKDDFCGDDNFDYPEELDTEQDFKDEKSHKQFYLELSNQQTDSKLVSKPEFKSKAIDLKLICHDCGGSFTSKCKLKVHWKKAHMLASLVCPFCKRAFKSYKAFHVHRKKKSQSCEIAGHENVKVEGVGRARVFICIQCNYKSKRPKDISTHIRTHTGDRPYKCNICSKTYTQQSSLQGHQEDSHQMYLVQMTCHICGKFVKGRRKVSRHLISHSQVDCPVCHKTITKLSYKQHMKRHSGTKSYACETCASTFYTLAELCNHKRFKHSKKSLKCDLCDFTTNNQKALRNHKSKHTNKNIPCIECGKFFLTNEKLVLHQRIHYSDKKFNCPKCDSSFFKRDSVRRHLKDKHSADTKQETAPVIKSEVNELNHNQGTT